VGTTGYIALAADRFVHPLFGGAPPSDAMYTLLAVPVLLILLLIVPVTFTFSILRYRLFQIDLVIRRTLVYTTLTAILAGLYVASTGFFQRLFVALTGTHSEGAVVLTTLVVAAAFTPVKSELQSLVDRYVKEVPDPTKALKAFGEQVRWLGDLLDGDQLCRRVLEESLAAFQAEGGAVYQWRDGHLGLVHTSGEWTGNDRLSAWLEHDGQQYGLVYLGPRQGGLPYTEGDSEVFTRIVGDVARALALVPRADFAALPPGERTRMAPGSPEPA
jgi:hypothetical protein